MIDSIKGILVKKNPTSVIIDIGGIRLGIPITLATFEKIPDPNQAVELLTYLQDNKDNTIVKQQQIVDELQIPSSEDIAKMSWGELDAEIKRLAGE